MPEVSNLYTGPTSIDKHARDVNELEKAFFGSIRVDWILSEMAEKTPYEGSMTVIDVGSGSGAFISGLRDEIQVPEFLSRIARRNLYVNALGFTDSPSPEDLNCPVKDFIPQESNKHVEVQNYYYTLTASQTLAKFLDSRGVDRVDFFLASQSLMYVSARVFEVSIDEMLDRLKPGGKALVWGVGSLTGPLPAFVDVDASELRSKNFDSDSHLLNLFIPDTRISTEMPLLTLASDWSETKTRLESIISKLSARNLVSTDIDSQEMQKQLEKFQTYQSNLEHFGKLREKGFAKISKFEAEIAIRFYLQLHPALNKLRADQYRKQVAAKQSYVERLSKNQQLKFKVLRERQPSGVDAFLMEKI